MNAFTGRRSSQVAALRWSLLVSLGLIPIACGGTTLRGGDDDDDGGSGSGNGGSSAGKTSTAGKPSKAGTSSTSTGGATSSAGTSSGGKTSMGGAPSRSACTPIGKNPVTGLVKCREGHQTRPQALECELPIDGFPPVGGAGGEGPGPKLPRATGAGCFDDADCAGFELGYCEPYSGDCFEGGIGGATGVCASGCSRDADCGPGHLCLCDGSEHGGSCVSAKCRTDAECGESQACATLNEFDTLSFVCTSSADECFTNDDCGDFSVCTYTSQEKRRTCIDVGVCGRPFLVEAAPRLPPVVTRGDWTELGLAPRVAHLTAAEREAQAAHWTKLGQMEHASIAAFARFQLQLLALGAASELVQACNQALVDETHHTQLCFALASVYAGKHLGPGPLDVSHSLDVTSLADIVELVIAEGCFGETSAALEALRAAADASDPVIRSAYARIAEDEQRHAELAFRFLKWALERGDSSMRERVSEAISAPPTANRDALAVALPCLEALLRLPELGAARAPVSPTVI